MRSPQATYEGHVRSPASHYAPGATTRSESLSADQRDILSLVVWSLFIALVFLIPVVGIYAIRVFG